MGDQAVSGNFSARNLESSPISASALENGLGLNPDVGPSPGQTWAPGLSQLVLYVGTETSAGLHVGGIQVQFKVLFPLISAQITTVFLVLSGQ